MARQHGFTLPELIAVMVVLGILAAVALPRMMDNRVMVGSVFRSDVVSALRFAQKSAVSHRRLVCATLTPTTVTLAIASANPATTCDTALSAPDGSPYKSKDASVQASGYPPGGMLYFQTVGSITGDGAGTSVYSGNIAITGQSNPIRIDGVTGYVE